VRVLAGAPLIRFLRGKGQQCTPLVMETMPGQRRPEDRISTTSEEAVAVAQESEFLAVNQKIRVRIPAVTPFQNARDAAVVEAADCKPALTGASPGARSISGPSSKSKTTQWHCVDRGAIPRGSTI
jgi:hypothetical protein